MKWKSVAFKSDPSLESQQMGQLEIKILRAAKVSN